MPNLVGMPGLGNQQRQPVNDFLPFTGHQVVMIQPRQAIGHFIVLEDQCTPGHFGGVRGEHKLYA